MFDITYQIHIVLMKVGKFNFFIFIKFNSMTVLGLQDYYSLSFGLKALLKMAIPSLGQVFDNYTTYGNHCIASIDTYLYIFFIVFL